MKNILIVSGHTDLNDSVANKTILEEYKKLFPAAEIDYLDKLYPDYQIDILAEQQKLVNANIIILQFPVFWYHFPSILERWMEQSFQHGFSHGSTGDRLTGKKLIASFTTGAPEELYHKNALMGYEIEEFFPAIKATCALTKMEFAGFVYTGGVSYQNRNEANALSVMKEKAIAHANKVAELVNSLI
ncbi:MAG: NAD(P)H-dependent oxidoreductase [Bacteroidales bacterium]|jgi:putative NADPH-quinone reductase|nr:NAD(P)H-dependent oxidoreductase [Bacteroidales bacterium]